MGKERAELHMHTKMSETDGIASIGEYIKYAVERGYPAIGLTDHSSVQAFPEAMRTAEEFKKQGQNIKVIYGMEAYCADKKDAKPYHLTLLVQNQAGLKNLYSLVSLSYRQSLQGAPIIIQEELKKHRAGLLIGSGCGNGKLFCAAAQGIPQEELCAIAREYDFLEIQPAWNYKQAIPTNEKVLDELQRINRIIVRIGEKVQIPVCATGNVHYLEAQDAQARLILKKACGFEVDKIQSLLHFRSTREMLEAFDYLGREKAYEVVIENTNKIAERIEEVRPIPQGIFHPDIDAAEKQLEKIVRDHAETLYGMSIPGVIKERIGKELSVVQKQKTASLFLIARMQVIRSEEQGHPVMTRGSVGASLLSYLTGISEVNPLPPHYRCPKCRYIAFLSNTGDESGFDLPRKVCPACGEEMERDGQNIPWQDFFGMDGEKIPDFELNFSSEYISGECARQYLEELLGKARVVNAGSVAVIRERLARQYLIEYEEKTGTQFPGKTKERYIKLLTGVKRGFGRLPGGLVVIPDGFAAEDFTPIQYAENDLYSPACTHFDFHDLGKTLLRLDNLGYDVPTLYRYLEQYTGIPAANADLFDAAVYERLSTPASSKTTMRQPVSPAIQITVNGIPKSSLKNQPPKKFGSLRKVFEYGFQKAYATELALAAVRLSWYRLYCPEEFDKAYQHAGFNIS